MASNNDVTFFIFDSGTGAPLTGVVPTWLSLREVSTETDQLGSAPAIQEVAAVGIYKFSRPGGTYHWVGVIDCGASALSRYQPIEIRSEETLDAVNLIGTPTAASIAADIAVSDAVVDAIKLKTDLIPSDFQAQLTRALGMLHENSVLDDTTFDANNNMTDGRLRLYDSKANAEAAGATGLQATYTISATYTGVQLTSYTMVKEP